MMELNCCSYCRVSLCESGSWMCAKVFPHSRYKRQRRNTVEIQWIGVPHKRTVSPWQCGMRVHKKSRSFSHWFRLRYPALGSKDNKTLQCIQCASWRLLTCTCLHILGSRLEHPGFLTVFFITIEITFRDIFWWSARFRIHDLRIESLHQPLVISYTII